ncbi:MAG TPA: hypothetical protein VF516_38640 [Kofleriaceae bacterium]
MTDAPRTPERPTERTIEPPAEAPGPDEPVPRLPRGRGMRFSRPELFRVAGLAILLVFLLVTQRPCADAVSRFVTSFGDNGSAAAPLPRPGTVDLPAGGAGSDLGSDLDRYEQLRPGMSEAEIKAAIERARARAHSGSGERSSGDAPTPSPPPPSGPPPR